MIGSSVLQWDTVGGQGQSEGHINVFGGYRLLHGLFPWPRPFESRNSLVTKGEGQCKDTASRGTRAD